MKSVLLHSQFLRKVRITSFSFSIPRVGRVVYVLVLSHSGIERNIETLHWIVVLELSLIKQVIVRVIMIAIGIYLGPSGEWRSGQGPHGQSITLFWFRLNHDSLNLLVISSKWLDLNWMRLGIDDIFFIFFFFFCRWKFPLSCLGVKIIGKRWKIYSQVPELHQSVSPLGAPTDVGLSLDIPLLVGHSVDTFHHPVLSLHLRPEHPLLL